MSDEASFTLKMNPDLWLACEKSENPQGALKERVLKELDMQGFDKFELEAIGSDPLFNQSLADEYRAAYRQFHGWRHSYPGSIKLHYQKLGSRKKSGKPEKED